MVMAETQLVLRCPYCQCVLEAKPPDSWHFEYSFEEPYVKSMHGEVKKREVVCDNPECGKTFVVYWYAPIEYYNIM